MRVCNAANCDSTDINLERHELPHVAVCDACHWNKQALAFRDFGEEKCREVELLKLENDKLRRLARCAVIAIDSLLEGNLMAAARLAGHTTIGNIRAELKGVSR